MPEITAYRPLPAQPWGLLPTEQFWIRAWLTPVAVVYWPGFGLYVWGAEALGLGWWQTALGMCVFHQVWGGILERASRWYLARRARLGPPPAAAITPAGDRITASVELYESFWGRVPVRLRRIAQILLDVTLLLLLFAPGWLGPAIVFAALAAHIGVVQVRVRRMRSLRDTHCIAAKCSGTAE